MLAAGHPVGHVAYADFCFSMTTPLLRDTTSPTAGFESPPMIFHVPHEQNKHEATFEPAFEYLPTVLSALHLPNDDILARACTYRQDLLCSTDREISLTSAQMVAQDTATSGQSAEFYISDPNEETTLTSAQMVAQDAATSGQSAEFYISDTNEETT
jgi:hypothetical protein